MIGTDPVTGQTLQALTDMDFRLAIDDFGTGYSNLICLGTASTPVDRGVN